MGGVIRMADPELNARLDALENKIAALHEAVTAQAPAPVTITAEDMKAFNKVKDALANPAADFGDFCGINDCFRGPIIHLCGGVLNCSQVCIRECTCGPCSPVLNPALGNIARFSQFSQ
jgi:hypothetical protein